MIICCTIELSAAGREDGQQVAHNPYIRKAYEAIVSQDYNQAAGWFAKAVEQEPDNAAHHYRYSITLARSDKLAKALEHAERAVALEPGSALYRMHLDMLKARRLLGEADGLLSESGPDSLEAAVARLEEATRLDPLSVEALLVLAEACRRTGRTDKALRAVTDALKLDPGHREAIQLLEELRNAKREHTETGGTSAHGKGNHSGGRYRRRRQDGP